MAEPLAGALWRVDVGDAVEWLNGLDADSVDLVFGSPPYCDARTYGIGAQRGCVAWVEWMLAVTEAAARVCRGPVFWVAAGVTRGRNYWPACEGLLWEWWKRGGTHQLYRPCCWHKVDDVGGGTGIPGSGGDDYLRADWEYVLCFKRPGKLAWSDNTALGHPPVEDRVGGAFSNRTADGQRINAHTGSRLTRWKDRTRRPSGRRNGKVYSHPELTNPGNIISARVGGGHIGSRLAHEGEAPFPERLAEFFVRSFCPTEVCSRCGTAVQCRHENKTLPALSSAVPDLGIPRREEPILLQGVCLSGAEEAEGELSGVRGADPAHQAQPRSEVLLQGVCEPEHGEASHRNQVPGEDATGIHPGLPAESPEGRQGRLCDGTQAGDGKSPRKAPRKRRGRTSQKREEGRQQTGEPGVDDEAGARSPAEGAVASDRLSEVRPRHTENKAACKACGADLTLPGAIRPGIVVDPFSGSGTTAAVAVRWGRRALACDLRPSQVELTRRRVAEELTLFDQRGGVPEAAPEPTPAEPAEPPAPSLFDQLEDA